MKHCFISYLREMLWNIYAEKFLNKLNQSILRIN